jgi:proteasome lid subunit RPN8/RPN11
MIRMRQEVLDQAFEHLRRCGEGRRECVAYLIGPVDDPSVVDAVTHPPHAASAEAYELDSATIGEISTRLLASRRSVRIQIHTHPGPAYHSRRDDAFALVHAPGYLSLVIPAFARGPVGLDGAFLAERTHEGGWRAVAPTERLEIFP